MHFEIPFFKLIPRYPAIKKSLLQDEQAKREHRSGVSETTVISGGDFMYVYITLHWRNISYC